MGKHGHKDSGIRFEREYNQICGKILGEERSKREISREELARGIVSKTALELSTDGEYQFGGLTWGASLEDVKKALPYELTEGMKWEADGEYVEYNADTSFELGTTAPLPPLSSMKAACQWSNSASIWGRTTRNGSRSRYRR